MLTMKNLTRYVPDFAVEFPDIPWLQTEDGLDWYYHRERFAADTVKICIDGDGMIRSFSTDVQMLVPEGLTVTEVPAESVPPEMVSPHGWRWDGEKIVAVAPPETVRTRAEILADILRLQKEVESLSD